MNNLTQNSDYSSGNISRDDLLWLIAKRIAAFKWSAVSYFSVNCLLVAIWYFTSGQDSYFWPIWPILGWGSGIALQYFRAYSSSEIFSIEKEYKKLKNQQ